MFSERRRRRKSRRFVVSFGIFCQILGLCFQFPVLIWFSCYNCERIDIFKLFDCSVQCLNSIKMWVFWFTWFVI